MDIEEFEKQVQPGGKRSRLGPFKSQIFELKAKGYADWQVKDWLATNGVEISRQAVQQFFKKEGKTEVVRASSESISRQRVINTELSVTSPAPQGEALPQHEIQDPPVGQSQLETNRARRERKAQQFIKDGPSNSILKQLAAKQS